MNKAFFIDRDGTINKYVPYITNIEDFEIMDGVSNAIQMINTSDWLANLLPNFCINQQGTPFFFGG